MPPAQANTTPKTKPANSTQSALLISEIKDGVVVMEDGSLRAVILASAINFDLMSPQEQDAVEFAFQAFLNSLHFPIQILIKSQRMDLDNYLEKLEKLRQEQDNQLLAVLMDDYVANIRALLEEVNIMDKQFFVVVPFFPPLAPTKNNLASNLANLFKPTKVVTMGTNEFEQYKTELAQRVQQAASQLLQMGVRAVPLNTQELIDLYYTSYNPDVATNQKLIDATQFQAAAVTRAERPEHTEPAVLPTSPGANAIQAPADFAGQDAGVAPAAQNNVSQTQTAPTLTDHQNSGYDNTQPPAAPPPPQAGGGF